MLLTILTNTQKIWRSALGAQRAAAAEPTSRPSCKVKLGHMTPITDALQYLISQVGGQRAHNLPGIQTNHVDHSWTQRPPPLSISSMRCCLKSLWTMHHASNNKLQTGNALVKVMSASDR